MPRDFSRQPLTDAEQAMLDRLAEGARSAGNASVAANPSDPAFWMLLDGRISIPTVYLEGCYICEDPEFAQMGLPLCSECPECLRQQRGLGHIPADDVTCDVCGYEHGPYDYDGEGLITGIPRDRALAIKEARHPSR
jgi:hypothetical protein